MSFHHAPTTFVSQLHLYVSHIERSIKFYQQVLGFSILERVDDKVVLTVNGETPILTLETPKHLEARNPRSTGLYHFAILLPSRGDLARFVMHLLKMKVRFGASDHLVSEAIYFSDPDLNGIEVYVDRHPDTWSWNQGKVAMSVDELNYDDLLKDINVLSLWDKAPKDTVLGHIHLHVKELKETVKFYVDGLGFQIVSRLGDSALFISDNGYHHHIGLNTWQGVSAPEKRPLAVGLHFFTVQYPSTEKRDEVIERLLKMNYGVEKQIDGYFVLDPSKNLIKLSV